MISDLLARALIHDSRFEAVATPQSDLLRLLATRDVDVVVIGADFSSDSGPTLELASEVCRVHPNLYVVIHLSQFTPELVVSAFRLGARGVFSRERPTAEFLDCIEHVGKGFMWAGRQEATALLEAIKSIPAPTLLTSGKSLPLSARELQTVLCAATGKTNKSIATELGLSEHTVKNYMFRAFEKLGVSSRVELLLYLTSRGYTSNDREPK
jgi:DNA-binding NarL/FixJ family response regulator